MAWSKSTRITIMLCIDTAFFILELGVGLAVGSLALMADAFHMLNDIISLAVGLWAVKAAQKSSTDKYSFGYLRAEILGAFFNAIFLIALCLSIILEAVTRLLDPPKISNAMLILIVGSCGLASNLGGFFVLGGHGHSHGPEEHSHDHGDGVRAAEEGHNHHNGGHIHSHGSGAEPSNGNAGEVFPEAVVERAKSRGAQHIRFSDSFDDTSPTKDGRRSSSISRGSRHHRRRASSIISSRFTSIDDISIHPASFRNDIIAASRPHLEGIDSGDSTGSEEDAVDSDLTPTENSPLISRSNRKSSSKSPGGHDHSSENEHHHQQSPRKRHDSWHALHNHNKPKKTSKGGHSHSHGDMGMNAMILHVIGDALGNVGVIATALIIWLTTWPGRFYADPAVSLLISFIILRSTIPLTFATAKILLQATPDHIDVNDIKEDIQSIPGVISCHHVHIWQLSDTQIIASLHVQLNFPISEASAEKYMEVAKAARKCLHAYGIHSATIQPEFCLDKDHDHDSLPLTGLDGIVGQPRCRLDDDCLLECVDDCAGKGCCVKPTAETSQSHDDHHDHSH